MLREQHRPRDSAVTLTRCVGGRHPEVVCEARHDLAARHEALRAELDDPSILAGGPELTAEPGGGLEQRDPVAGARTTKRDRETGQSTTDDRERLHGGGSLAARERLG